jgi:hypothetical protein
MSNTIDANKVFEQIRTMLLMHSRNGSCDESNFWMNREGRNMTAATAAEIALSLAELFASLPGMDPSFAGRLRSMVVRALAFRRRVQGHHELRVAIAIAWLEQKFWDRKEWPYYDLLHAAVDEADNFADGGPWVDFSDVLLSREVLALPIKRKTVTDAHGWQWWHWVAEARWPEGHARGDKPRKKKQVVDHP